VKAIGVITYHQSINYGANLQAYALQEVLKGMGYVPEIIDYNNPHMRWASLSRLRWLRHIAWRNIARLLAGTERQERTKRFRQRCMRMSTRQYSDLEALHSDPPSYDAYVTGSDQVWNPFIQGNDPSYFLTFAPVGRRRISYAASFGLSRIPDQFITRYGEWLNQIHYLSTREAEGKRIIKQLTGREAEVTLDPTLLLDERHWREIAVPYDTDEPYILCYHMPGDKVVDRSINEIARHVSTLMGWGIVSIGQREYMGLVPWRRSVFNAGPAEFLGLVQNASFIVTNSFHGTAFAVNYKKPFAIPVNLTIPPERTRNSRIASLLRMLELEDRLVPAGERMQEGYVPDIDYRRAGMMLQEQRQKSIDFLRDSLEGA
jgi:hypothetical protein